MKKKMTLREKKTSQPSTLAGRDLSGKNIEKNMLLSKTLADRETTVFFAIKTLWAETFHFAAINQRASKGYT